MATIVYENVIYINLSVSFYGNITFWNSKTSHLSYVFYKVGSFKHNAIVPWSSGLCRVKGGPDYPGIAEGKTRWYK
jgi:hypothetical protein